jgi:hypothetical protein
MYSSSSFFFASLRGLEGWVCSQTDSTQQDIPIAAQSRHNIAGRRDISATSTEMLSAFGSATVQVGLIFGDREQYKPSACHKKSSQV